MPHVTINWTISQRDSFEVSHELAKKVKALIESSVPGTSPTNPDAPMTFASQSEQRRYEYSSEARQERIDEQRQEDQTRADELTKHVGKPEPDYPTDHSSHTEHDSSDSGSSDPVDTGQD